VTRLMAKDPAGRPESGDEAAVMLRAMAALAEATPLEDEVHQDHPVALARLRPVAAAPPRMLPPAVDPGLERAMLGPGSPAPAEQARAERGEPMGKELRPRSESAVDESPGRRGDDPQGHPEEARPHPQGPCPGLQDDGRSGGKEGTSREGYAVVAAGFPALRRSGRAGEGGATDPGPPSMTVLLRPALRASPPRGRWET